MVAVVVVVQCVPAISNTFGVPTVLLPLSIVIIIDGIFAALEVCSHYHYAHLPTSHSLITTAAVSIPTDNSPMTSPLPTMDEEEGSLTGCSSRSQPATPLHSTTTPRPTSSATRMHMYIRLVSAL